MTALTIALNVLDTDFHVTLAFMEPTKTKKARNTQETGKATVFDIVYWSESDVTVALIHSHFVMERFEYWKSLGYTYNYEFKPHFTLSKGNSVDYYQYMIGSDITLGEEYFRLY